MFTALSHPKIFSENYIKDPPAKNLSSSQQYYFISSFKQK